MKHLLIFPLRNLTLVALSSLSLILTPTIAQAEQPSPVDLNTIIPEPPKLESAAYFLIDYHSGRVLAEFNADERRDPASLTKMMTSYVIGQFIKNKRISLDDTVVISKDASTQNPEFKGSSLMFLEKSSKVKVKDLNRGIIIQSGNDACVAMAEHTAGSQNGFISLMNTYAENIGLKNTHFATVHGLDAENQYSTARDMALLAQALIRDTPDEYAIYKEKDFKYNGILQKNRNKLLFDTSLNVDGVKTGHTNRAGYNLVSSATQDSMRLIAVVMGGKSEASRAKESKQLLSWGFRYFETIRPIPAGKVFTTERIWFGAKSQLPLGTINDIWVTIPRTRSADLKANYKLLISDIHAPIKKGQQVGTISLILDDQIVSEHPLVAMENVEEGGFFSRLLDYILLFFHQLFS